MGIFGENLARFFTNFTIPFHFAAPFDRNFTPIVRRHGRNPGPGFATIPLRPEGRARRSGTVGKKPAADTLLHEN